jgi:uncharacterized protein
MKVFFDTSSLFKLYHQETDSGDVESIFTDYKVTDVFLSELCKVEFLSPVWKKVRVQEITGWQANKIIDSFEQDFGLYTFIQIDSILITQARRLLMKYSPQGLRTLDSIQLSTAVLLINQADLFQSADKLLKSLMNSESLPTERPVY